MVLTMFRERWGADFADKDASIAAFNAHNARVRREVPAGRLLVWQAGDGWAPICTALHLEIPAEPFPRTNTREEWQARRAANTEQGKS